MGEHRKLFKYILVKINRRWKICFARYEREMRVEKTLNSRWQTVVKYRRIYECGANGDFTTCEIVTNTQKLRWWSKLLSGKGGGGYPWRWIETCLRTSLSCPPMVCLCVCLYVLPNNKRSTSTDTSSLRYAHHPQNYFMFTKHYNKHQQRHYYYSAYAIACVNCINSA